MSEPITAAVSDRICKHMNKDHADAVLVYVQVYGNLPAATAAQMDAIDPAGMTLTAEVEGVPQPVRIAFERPLENAKEAHTVLVEMLKRPEISGSEA